MKISQHESEKMKRNQLFAALTLVALSGAFVLAEAPMTNGGGMGQPAPMGGDMKGMMDKTSPDMKTMMEKMPPEMKMQCQMLMSTAVSPSDPAAILALKDKLKLTEAQTAQLEAINKDARDKALVVLTADQKKTLETMPKSPQTMKDMHEQMMGKMQTMMGGKMGDKQMNCPMMNMMGGGATTQPAQDKPAASPKP